MSDDRHEAVSRRAYELWEKEGGGHGRHEDHWHRANDELGKTAKGDGGTAAAPDGTTLTGTTSPRAVAKPRAKAAASPAAAPSTAAKAPAAKPRKPKPAK